MCSRNPMRRRWTSSSRSATTHPAKSARCGRASRRLRTGAFPIPQERAVGSRERAADPGSCPAAAPGVRILPDRRAAGPAAPPLGPRPAGASQHGASQHGAGQHGPGDGANGDKLAALVEFEAERASAWYAKGLTLIPLLDWRSAASAGAMAGIYHRLLERIAATPGVVLERRMSLSASEKALVAARSLVVALRPHGPGAAAGKGAAR